MVGRFVLASLAAFASVAAGARPALATTVLRVPLAQMAREAEVIVHAVVAEQRVEWDKSHKRLLTFTTLEVLHGLAGAKSGDLLTVYQVGGALDGHVWRIPGALELATGEELVFFGQRFGEYVVSYGMGLGKLSVRREGGRLLLSPSYGDVTFMERVGGALVPSVPPALEASTLDELELVVRGARKAGGPR